jgi:hypothetical protein
MVNLARYRAMVSWRVPGIGVEPGASWLTLPKRAAAPEQSSSEAVAVSGSDPPRPSRRRSGPQH